MRKKEQYTRAYRRLFLQQMIFCLAAIGIVFITKSIFPDGFEFLRRQYYNLFSEQSSSSEPQHFTQTAGVILQADAAAKAPDGASLKRLNPTQETELPVEEYTVSSAYGWRKHPVTGEKQSFHNGIDLACAEGTAVSASMDGMVKISGSDELNGNYLVLLHENGVSTHYCHLQYSFVRTGEFVSAGQLMGTAGQTGRVTGPHLHFSVKQNGVWYDPNAFLVE
ncbi:MAG: M23 family metallopeptidase [Faecalibacterium sp.]|nr:M23 family metallopeptidase [Faecalibacterium sp.]